MIGDLPFLVPDPDPVPSAKLVAWKHMLDSTEKALNEDTELSFLLFTLN